MAMDIYRETLLRSVCVAETVSERHSQVTIKTAYLRFKPGSLGLLSE